MRLRGDRCPGFGGAGCVGQRKKRGVQRNRAFEVVNVTVLAHRTLVQRFLSSVAGDLRESSFETRS